MFERKARPGKPFRVPGGKAWNDIVESAEQYSLRRNADDRFRPGHQINPAVIVAKNSSGAGRKRGEVLELSSLLVTTVTPDGLVYDGVEPTTSGAKTWGIVRRELPSAAFDEIQIAGACIGRVNVTSTSHKFARVEAGTSILQSSPCGPLQLIVPAGSTGTQELGVIIRRAPLSFAALITTGITAASDAASVRTLGTGVVTLYERDQSTDELVAISGMTGITVYNTTAQIGFIDTWIQVKETASGDFYWDVGDCPA